MCCCLHVPWRRKCPQFGLPIPSHSMGFSSPGSLGSLHGAREFRFPQLWVAFNGWLQDTDLQHDSPISPHNHVLEMAVDALGSSPPPGSKLLTHVDRNLPPTVLMRRVNQARTFVKKNPQRVEGEVGVYNEAN